MRISCSVLPGCMSNGLLAVCGGLSISAAQTQAGVEDIEAVSVA